MGTAAAAQRRHLLWSNIRHFHLCANILHQPQSAIVPLIVGENEAALSASKELQTASGAGELGFWVPAIRYPTVPKGTARLRVTLSAAHSQKAIESLGGALQRMSLG
jgi:7-keto-8-aminopelargonate synthetase-like enzyme